LGHERNYMETITFYSYKGGVGRTLALANIALYLSQFGQKVCIIDFDLEAPGVHYKLSPFFTGPIEKGMVDFIYEYALEIKNTPKSISNFVMKANVPDEYKGELLLIPAGNVKSSEYWRRLASIDWNGFFYKEEGIGVPFFLELKELIQNELKPDFLLIDSRSGITETSGICTVLLPDKVVFLICNNLENIEGSRQISRSIQKSKRLKGQKVIEVHFVLTRIPTPGSDTERFTEEKIIEDIKEFFDKDAVYLEDRLDIPEISVLHSDRELELLESLRLNKINKEMPLTRDYLKLFSRIIPEKIIKSKIDTVVENIIISHEKLFDDPGKVEKELEALIEVYPHPKSFEKLIDFYFLRNFTTDKILIAYSELWRISKKMSDRMYSKFIEIFTKADILKLNDFHLEIAEEYLKSIPPNKVELELYLADLYDKKQNYKKAYEHYYNLIDFLKGKKEVLEKVFEFCAILNDYNAVRKLYMKYDEIINNTPSLKLKLVEIAFKNKNENEIKKLLGDDGVTGHWLLTGNPTLLLEIMGYIKNRNHKAFILTMTLKRVLKNGNLKELQQLGEIFYALEMDDTFKSEIPDDFPQKENILEELNKKRE
jgi:cellulose biosynthesis protein BcsQ